LTKSLIIAILAIAITIPTAFGATFTWEYDDDCFTEFHSLNQTDSTNQRVVVFSFFFECENDEAPITNPYAKIIPDAGAAWILVQLGEVLNIGEKEQPPEPEPEEPIIIEAPEVEEEPLTFEERQIKKSVDELDECWTGLGAWKAYQETERIQFYIDESRQSFGIRDNLSSDIHLKRIIMAILECQAMETYERKGLIGAYEFNKVEADEKAVDYLGRLPEHPLAKKTTDFTDQMVETDPITQKDREDEIEDMEKIFDAKYKDPYSDCIPDPDYAQKCENRGTAVPQLRSEFDYNTYLNFKAQQVLTPEDYAQTITNAKKFMCDEYFPKYNGTLSELPVWLLHCQ